MESGVAGTTTHSATTMDRDLDMGFLQQNIRLYLVRMYVSIPRDSQRMLCFARAASPAR